MRLVSQHRLRPLLIELLALTLLGLCAALVTVWLNERRQIGEPQALATLRLGDRIEFGNGERPKVLMFLSSHCPVCRQSTSLIKPLLSALQQAGLDHQIIVPDDKDRSYFASAFDCDINRLTVGSLRTFGVASVPKIVYLGRSNVVSGISFGIPSGEGAAGFAAKQLMAAMQLSKMWFSVSDKATRQGGLDGRVDTTIAKIELEGASVSDQGSQLGLERISIEEFSTKSREILRGKNGVVFLCKSVAPELAIVAGKEAIELGLQSVTLVDLQGRVFTPRWQREEN